MALRTTSALALLGATALAQYGGWIEDQANATMCTWNLPRVGIVRDTLYIDGGDLVWQRGMGTGEYTPAAEFNPRSIMLSLSLKKSFSTDDNITALLDTHPRLASNSKDFLPFYVDGALLSNDAQFFLYGGGTKESDFHEDPDSDFVEEFQAHAYGDDDDDFEAGFVSEELPEGVNRNVMFGVGVSAPSENKAWYFGGMRAEDHGIIHPPILASENRSIPDVMSDRLVSVEFDEDSQNSETWRNDSLPDSVGKRGGASGVFVPVGEHGILVFVGGVTHGEFANPNQKSSNAAALAGESEVFMTNIDIYDIATKEWHQQKTSGDHPPILAMGCAVVQPAADASSFNIYHYGGYRGADPREDFSDDVHVLSLPSFKWVKALAGTDAHARAGHRCVSPYPDQMMVIGGFVPQVGLDCLVGGVVQILNLSTLEWLDGYDPEVYDDYGVPDVVSKEIGGDAKGGATAKEPEGGWDDDDLGKVFEKSYPDGKIKVWYPYGSAASTDRPSVGGEKDKDDNGLPKWVAPTLGVVLGLIFVVCCGVAFVFWRRRKVLRRASMAASSAQGK